MRFYGYAPYVPVAQRREKAAREMKKLEKKGQKISPVVIEGRMIARNFWGKAWCENLERYSDYENRLPRGRTYVRNGSVVDLQIERGTVRAMVSGSEIYKVRIEIGTVEPKSWKGICGDCRGSVASLVELLQGKLSKNVMERVCRQGDGLFPTPTEIKMACSCPDGARMCKHVAAVMYGAGARLDHAPDLLFTLRGVDRADMIADVGANLPMTQAANASERVLADDDVAALFGIEMEPTASIPTTKTNTRARTAGSVPVPEKSVANKRQSKAKTTAAKWPGGVAAPPPIPVKKASGPRVKIELTFKSVGTVAKASNAGLPSGEKEARRLAVKAPRRTSGMLKAGKKQGVQNGT